jgi:hypothetical protein
MPYFDAGSHEYWECAEQPLDAINRRGSGSDCLQSGVDRRLRPADEQRQLTSADRNFLV